MRNLEKLIIVTSPNGDEYTGYWRLKDESHHIVKNGYKRGLFKAIALNPKQQLVQLEDQIENGFLIMIHLQHDPTFKKRTFERDGKIITYHVYYYTTQDELLSGDLWSIDSDYNYTGPDKNPSCPFDILRLAIQLGQDTAPAVKRIKEWVEKKTTAANILEVQLNTLHQCLTPEGAAKVAEVKNYDLIKNQVVASNLTADEFIKKKLVSEKDSFSDDYIQSLSQLRDALLEEETSKTH